MSGPGGAGSLDPAGEAPPPPPAPALLAAVASMRPVRTRAPARTLAALGALAAAVPAGALLVFGPRKDLGALPVAWVAAMAVAWAAALTVTLAAAAWPPRGEVLPDTARARRTAIAAAATLVLLGLFATVDGPTTTVPENTLGAFARGWWHCTSFALKAILPVLLVGGLLLRRLFPVGGGWAGAALGAAGGAAAGLALHLICAVGGGLHVGCAHAGGVVLGALLGLVALPRLLRS